jgi:hypothetical protein
MKLKKQRRTKLLVIKAQLVRVSGNNIVAVTGNYEATEQNYQDTT